MARAPLTLLTALRGGISIADAAMTAAVTDGHSFVNDGATVLLLLNTNAASRTVTIQTPGLVDSDLAVAERTIVLGIGSVTAVRIMTSVWPRTIYNQSDGAVYVDYSATANLSVAAVKIPRELYA